MIYESDFKTMTAKEKFAALRRIIRGEKYKSGYRPWGREK
jgi:hypothetical protein